MAGSLVPVLAGDIGVHGRGHGPTCAGVAAALVAGCAGRFAGSLVPVLTGVAGVTGALGCCSRPPDAEGRQGFVRGQVACGIKGGLSFSRDSRGPGNILLE